MPRNSESQFATGTDLPSLALGSMRTALLDVDSNGWAAGAVVSRTLAFALVSNGEHPFFVGQGASSLSPPGCIPIEVGSPRSFPGENTLRTVLKLPARSGVLRSLKEVKPKAALPIVELPVPNCPTIGWIPDFQHRYLPELFSEDEHRRLNRRHQGLSEKCRLMWCSSDSVARDFKKFFPAHAGKARVASFPSLFAYEPPEESTSARNFLYRVPEKFLLVINQFWAHKNHKIVAEALGLLRKAGLEVPTVMAGLPSDYRDKQNTALSETLQTLARNGSWPHSLVLGKVRRDELLQLLRSATVLVQPSRFEGWNTTVEDAKALGCPIILSDLEVHREQCPGALGFFGCDDPRALADILADNWSRLTTRPDAGRERESLNEARIRGLEFGDRLAAICAEAAQ